ncbi:MAG: alanine--tRNA ligase-related protein, partial [Patescibacteria group bacterium]
MLTASDIANKYISFFQKRGHQKISNFPLVLANDPTTLFTSSGMQPLVPYLLGQEHPSGKRLVNVQDCFRAQDIDEVGDNRHTTFFRMLGNWSLGDYFKDKQLPWIWEFLTSELNLDPNRLYVTVFKGNEHIPKDTESIQMWKELFNAKNIEAKEGERIFTYGAEKNWWSRAGTPEKMPVGEPGGPDSEIFYEFTNVRHDPKFGETCHVNCDCGNFIEICNSVFMQYIKKEGGDFAELPQKNVDFGGGLERLLLALEDTPDVFTTSLLAPVISAIEKETQSSYAHHPKEMRIITDHFISATFIALSSVTPSNKEQGYILRRLIRRALDNFYALEGKDISPVLQTIITQYADTNESLSENSERIKNTILEEAEKYER